jgi:flagellar hook-basal body complex protein FliE
MSGPEAIAALSSQSSVANLAAPQAAGAAVPSQSDGFGEILSQGLNQLETKIDQANEIVRAYAVDGSAPIHEVTIALEEARLAVELAMEVRNRVVEGYREIMNMQL